MVRGSTVYESFVRYLSAAKIEQDKNLSNFDNFRYLNNRNLKMGDFLQKLKMVVRIVLYRPAISQSGCKKAGPYQLQYNNRRGKSSVLRALFPYILLAKINWPP